MNIIDVAFHNTGADHRRVAPYRDYHSLDMAALGDKVLNCTTPQELRVIGESFRSSILAASRLV